MSRRPLVKSVDWLIEQIDEQLATFGKDRHALSLREKIISLVSSHDHFCDLGVSTAAEGGITAKAALDRIRLYLVTYVGEVIDSREIMIVAGVSDYPRRIRQLRVQQGYQIASGATKDVDTGINLKPDQYMLITAEPDRDAAQRWKIANRIRKSGVGSRERLLMFFKENVGKVVTTEELAYVARDAKDFGRRSRELRTQEGYAVATRFTGRPDLKSGQYILETLERMADQHDRKISLPAEKAVFARDESTCRICGWTPGQASKSPRILELHHLAPHKDGGSNEVANLVVLCSKCHDGVHSGRHVEEVGKLKISLSQTSSR